jgi:hypothetical protein
MFASHQIKTMHLTFYQCLAPLHFTLASPLTVIGVVPCRYFPGRGVPASAVVRSARSSRWVDRPFGESEFPTGRLTASLVAETPLSYVRHAQKNARCWRPLHRTRLLVCRRGIRGHDSAGSDKKSCVVFRAHAREIWVGPPAPPAIRRSMLRVALLDVVLINQSYYYMLISRCSWRNLFF